MKWFYLPLALGWLLLPYCQSARAQNARLIHGTVYQKDNKGKKSSLPDATIQALGTSTGAQADSNGTFTLSVTDGVARLVVSYIGYTADTVVLAPAINEITVTLNKPTDLKEVIISDRQKTTKVNLIGAVKMETIGKGELMKAACCNLSESFETTPSVDVAFTDAVSGYRQIMMLGLAGPYTLITRENIPDVRGLAAVTGLTYTPGFWIEGIQLSKGTGSVVNGHESVTGQINVELRKPFEEEKFLFNFYQNSQGRTELNAIFRHEFNKRLSSNLFVHANSQWLKSDENKDGFLDQPLGNQAIVLNRWFYKAPKGFELQGGIKGIYVSNTGGQWDYEKGTEQITGNPWGFQLNTRRIEGWAKIGQIFLAHPGTSVGLQLSGVYHNQDVMYGVRNYDGTQKSFYANLIFQSIINNTNHIIKGGISGTADNYDEQFELKQYSRTEIVPGAFTEYAYNYLEKFNLIAGLRGDYNNLYGGFVTPRLHMRYAPFKRTAIRASIGRAERTANIIAENMGLMASNRQFVVVSPGSGKAYGLEPEVAWNTGMNITQKFTLDYREGSFSVDYYYTGFQNQVVVDVEDPHFVSFYNLKGASFANSFQAQLDYEVIHHLDLRLAYRLYDVQTTYSGTLKEKPLVPRHRAFVNIGYATKKNWKFDYTIQWIGTKRVPALDNGNSPETYSPSYIQMNAQVSRSLSNTFEVYLGGENLTNYVQHNAIVSSDHPFGTNFDAAMIWGPIMGRTIYAGCRYKIK